MAPSQSTLASNNFCVSRHVADLVEELEAKRSSRKAKRNTWSDEEVREFQALCESRSVLTSMQIWNQTHGKKMSERSAYALKDHAPSGKRGRKDMLTDAEKNDVLDGIKMYNVLNKPVDASLVASMARGILGRDRSELLSENGGPYVISCSWARRFLHDNGFTVRAATSDRTVSLPEVKKAGLFFYDELKKYSHILPELVFNMDEFFCKLDETNREWTWVRASKGILKGNFEIHSCAT